VLRALGGEQDWHVPVPVLVENIEELIERVRGDKKLGDPSLENVQARLRTLMRYAVIKTDTDR
jgi:NH3-dependent NAD+ synthetase